MPQLADSSRALQGDGLGSLPTQKSLRTNPPTHTAGFSCVGFNPLFTEELNPTVALNPNLGFKGRVKPIELNPTVGFK